ncbi:MAG: Crp/Fnr family transcriptional regulator [Bacteroidales bacterium]|jgi:CRP-like cAMP-binding protein|nr:Crp/Fnr family transcriptional regulator [Bacteroidales bacterium]
MGLHNDIDIIDKLIPKNGILTDIEIDRLRSSGKTVLFNKKDVIYRVGTLTSHVMFLESGLIKLFKKWKNNKSIIIKIATPGDLIGLVSIFGESTFQYTASAIEDSNVYFVDISIFKSILENNGKYATYIFSEVCKDNLGIFERLTSQYYKQLPGKIADIILFFSENIYKSETFEFPITRNELAELAGTTKESFIRTLTEYKNDKIIEIEGKSIKIKSIDIIRTLSKIG